MLNHCPSIYRLIDILMSTADITRGLPLNLSTSHEVHALL